MALELFKLIAKIGADTSEFDNKVKKSEETGKSFSSVLKSGFKGGAMAGAAGIAAVTAGVVALTKKSIEAYSEYEQLIGGVDTLFGESSKQVQKYADEAYKTAGLSANQYMETVTGFSASLLQSLDGDTKKSAEYANRAVIDMSDNANKMGTDISSIQNAYQGFAKQNYTMLDNLKLGYGGTKEEMERLIEDASRMTDVQKELGVTIDSSSMSFGNIVNAISVMQSSMGIAGTTAKEASTTIQGSISSMKSAWNNFVVGLSNDGADIDRLISNLVDSVVTVGKNIIPTAIKSFSNIAKVVKNELPKIIDTLIKETKKYLPDILSSIISGVTTIFSGVLNFIKNQLPNILDEIISLTLENFPKLLSELINGVFDVISGLVETVRQYFPEIKNVIAECVDLILETLNNPTFFVDLILFAFDLIQTLVEAITENAPKIVEAVPEIIINLSRAFFENLPVFIQSGQNIITAILQGLILSFQNIKNWFDDKLLEVYDKISNYDWGQLITDFKNALLDAINKENIEEIGQEIGERILNALNDILNPRIILSNFSANLLNGISSKFTGNYVGSTLGSNISNKIHQNNSKQNIEISVKNTSSTSLGRELLKLIEVTKKEVYA